MLPNSIGGNPKSIDGKWQHDTATCESSPSKRRIQESEEKRYHPNGFAWLKKHGSKPLQNGIKMTNPHLTLNNKERKKEEIQQAFEEESYHQLF